ncbi:MAG: hypothetical protein JO368_02920 [Acidimicrobiales bacterium]|nr:hypothetical protein [Acidimicrobiales bacterium]
MAGIVALPAASAGAASPGFTSPGGGSLSGHTITTAALPYAGTKSPSQIQSLAASTLPSWSQNVKAGQNGVTYTPTILGGKPTVAKSTKINLLIIPVKFTFTSFSNATFDPTATNPGCGVTQSAAAGLAAGPEFSKSKFTAGAVKLGSVQYLDAQMRGEFWNMPGFQAKYNTVLKSKTEPLVSLNVSGGAMASQGTCQQMGAFDINSWNTFLVGTLFPSLAAEGVSPTTLPVFLFSNVVMYNGSTANCCIGGYHSAFDNSSFSNNPQVYGVADWDTTGNFGANTLNDAIPSHEIAEAANDPYVNNATPSWGHVGQVSGCQANLEVGDPLSGTSFTDTIAGVTYTLQELAYYGWFFDDNIGANGWYSTKGSFTTGATLCS